MTAFDFFPFSFPAMPSSAVSVEKKTLFLVDIPLPKHTPQYGVLEIWVGSHKGVGLVCPQGLVSKHDKPGFSALILGYAR